MVANRYPDGDAQTYGKAHDNLGDHIEGEGADKAPRVLRLAASGWGRDRQRLFSGSSAYLTFWQLGSLGGATWPKIASVGPIIVLAVAAMPFLAKGSTRWRSARRRPAISISRYHG
ncbi:hypothetical protein X768_32040 [Mesorhizobium sp. LSJC265A00]|nr:hypothetical protein X768_32040 [Mesorhizobium sp. LSJC265A00]